MELNVTLDHAPTTPAMRDHVASQIGHAVARFRNRIHRVDVHLADLNGPKGGVDKRCLVVAHFASHGHVRIDHRCEDTYKAVHEAAGKLKRAVSRRFDRLKER